MVAQTRTRIIMAASLAVSACLTSGLRAQGLDPGDVALARDNDRIITGTVRLSGQASFPERAFPGVFGELPNWTNDPGFDSHNGAFAPGTQIGFDVLRAVRVWDGCAFRVISQERILLRRGPLSATTPTSDVRTPGFIIGEANLSGRFHHHMSYELLAPAEVGVYLLELELWSTLFGLGAAEPIWVVFRQGEDLIAHERALAWVRWHYATPCRVDLDTSTGPGVLDIFDFLTFSNLFAMQDPRADFEPDCIFDIFDFLAFSNEFARGCE